MRRVAVVGVVVALVAAGCTSGSGGSTTLGPSTVTSTSSTSPATTAPVTTSHATPSTTVPTVVPTTSTGFDAQLTEVPLITEGTYPGPAWPTSLSGVGDADVVPSDLRDALVRNGFVIEPNTDTYGGFGVDELSWRTQFSVLYEQLSPYGERAVFVTTDVAYHLWHQVFDMVLRETEADRLLPVLEEFVAGLVEAARVQTAGAPDPAVADAALRAQEHLEAVATVLGLDVGPIGDRAAEEAALVDQATELAASPTVGGDCEALPASCVDYSLARPRGHYTRSEELMRYFKAMSMLGNTGFPVTDAAPLRVGLAVSRLIVTDEDLAAGWRTIYGPTAFLVGSADDYTPFEAAEAAERLDPNGLADLGNLSADAFVEGVGAELLQMRDVRIDPARASLRTMGARFVLDSWVYDQLTDPGVSERIRPTPLDFASVMGSDYAADIMASDGEDAAYPDYRAKVDDLSDQVAARSIDDWGRTVYDGWLWALEPVWAGQHEEAFPPFMRNDAWKAKSQTTGLGSYTELKHDTILYAKQGIAEGEGPPEPPPPPRHWVEPDPVAFGRLASLAAMMRDGLISAGLMADGDFDLDTADSYGVARTRWVTEFLLTILDRLERIAADELEGTPISDEDNIWLGDIGVWISALLETIGEGSLDPSPLVADVFLDPFADEVLELGTGPLDTIHVLVPDDDGRFRVATGVVYSYYEFWGPRAERLTDEEWWDRIIAGDLPDRPQWWLDAQP